MALADKRGEPYARCAWICAWVVCVGGRGGLDAELSIALGAGAAADTAAAHIRLSSRCYHQ